MKNINDLHTTGKNSRNIQSKRTKGFGYQVLGFGAGGAAASNYIEATGGATTITDGDYKIHVFTGDATLCVSNVGCCAPCSGAGSNLVDYIVVAGGGAGGGSHGGGGGGGGLRDIYASLNTYGSASGIISMQFKVIQLQLVVEDLLGLELVLLKKVAIQFLDL